MKIPGVPAGALVMSTGVLANDPGQMTLFYAAPGAEQSGRISWKNEDGKYDDVYFGVDSPGQFQLGIGGKNVADPEAKYTSISFNKDYIYVTGARFSGKPGKQKDTVYVVAIEQRTGEVVAVQYEVSA